MSMLKKKGGGGRQKVMYKGMLPTFYRYLFTWFSLISLAQQGVYDVVSSFGAMAARLIFSKVEEAAYFYFSQTVSRGRPKVLSVTNSVLSTGKLHRLERCFLDWTNQCKSCLP